MSDQSVTRPSLLRPSGVALAWHACTWLGWGLVVVAVTALGPAQWRSMGAPMVAMLGLVVASELRPIANPRAAQDPVSISPAFVFAAMYLWGLFPALVVQAVAVAFSELRSRKELWRLLFNVGQYSLSTGAAWLVLHLGGSTATALSPTSEMSAWDLLWAIGSWVAYHLVNVALVACMAPTSGQTWWGSFSDEFWFYTGSTFAVLALSPMVAVTAVASDRSWTLMPLLLLPLIAVQRAEQMSRDREYQSLHDPLTNLPNRLLLNDRLEVGLARASRAPGAVAVIFLDLDHFKVINDGLGHSAGDALLVDVARRLGGVIRKGDTLARFGGDEFAIVCESVPEPDVAMLAERIRRALADPFTYGGREVTISASLGVVVAADQSTAQTMLRDADAAMYRAKSAGRDQVVHFHRTMHEQAANRLDEQLLLRRALKRNELRVFYQPVIDLASGMTVGVEALARWQHPERGLLGPCEFIPLAEETGLVVPLGGWVLDHALGQLRQWRSRSSEAADLWVAVNLSARQMRDPNLVDRVAQALHHNGLPPGCLHLEITETVLMDSLETTIDTLERLRNLGVRMVVDDFGTGYSSLAYLKRLPVATLKIDRSFVDGLAQGASDMSIVDAIVNLARALNLGVIAEGVETIDQVGILRNLGAHAAQGYLWSQALPAAEIEAWILPALPDRAVQLSTAFE